VERYSLAHLADQALLRDLASLVAQDRATTADLLAHIAEVDARRLFRRMDCASMHDYCERKLGLSVDAAGRRIQAARLARRYPEIFLAVADGRLSLTAVCLLSPVLEHAEPTELLAAAAHRTKEELLLLIAERFPKPNVPTSLIPIGPAQVPAPSAPEVSTPVGPTPAAPESDTDPRAAAAAPAGAAERQHAPAHVAPAAPQRVSPPTVLVIHRATLVPLSPGHRKFTGTFDEETVDLLLRAQTLLSHTLPSSDYVEVLKRVLQDWVRAAECRKYGLTEKPRERSSAGDGRYIPANVKRAVFKRDGGRCTFVGDDKRRCGTRKLLQFDHVIPVAKGGRTTVENLRLRCRRHNQVEADREFGAGFMDRKRERRAETTLRQRPGTQIQDTSARDSPA
jgi:hypothetical protein